MRLLFIALLLAACAKDQSKPVPGHFALDVKGVSIEGIGEIGAPLSSREAKARASMVLKSK